MKKWVDIVSHHPRANSVSKELLARCVLIDGRVDCEGDARVIKALERVVDSASGKAVTPVDGEEFLSVLERTFRNPGMMATPVRIGEPQPFGI